MTDVIDAEVGEWLSRFERFDVVGSTNDVVAGWLAEGTEEVCVAVADVQTSGRGRGGRTWEAPPGGALLLSVGFRPTWLDPEHAWRLAAIVTLTMAGACEVAAGLRPGMVQLKWPNDLVAIDARSGDVRKLAGVLGETDGLGTEDARAIIGIGVNADWRAEDFPAELATTMTSLAELAPGQQIDREVIIHEFLERLDHAIDGLRLLAQ
jgi:BirA family biotin operon repressor/biotin-[acetyl-CoA-carboxylase] ligase